MMANKLRYRVNFGQGQVHYPEPNHKGLKSACFEFIANHPDPREWFRTGTNQQ